MSLLDVIKRAALEASESANPVAVYVGTVLKNVPLEVSISEKLTLTADFLLLTAAVHDQLQVSDRVVVLRLQGGHLYVVLDKVMG